MNEERILHAMRGVRNTTIGPAGVGTVEVHCAGKTLPEAIAAGGIRFAARSCVRAGGARP